MFQSSPGWLAGRCGLLPDTPSGYPLFQSSPGWLAGRCQSFRILTVLCNVSILARLVGRALPHHRYSRQQVLGVSILARLVGRALPG